ncbi:hypothetical protein ABNF97_32440 [Plantactinospora sp. B6F1]|uniref:hypothetical protein n=1 Tax=Plantactinospora sp. B6F1 TaxID=3158971 RepID=UPI0010CEE438
MIDENPANDPTREWITNGHDVAFDARALLRKIDSNGQGLVRYLAERAGSPVATQTIATDLGVSTQSIEDCVAWINKLAEALGYVPLVIWSGVGLLITTDAAVVARQGLIDAQR